MNFNDIHVGDIAITKEGVRYRIVNFYYTYRNFGEIQQHNNMNPPTVWRWLNRVTKMPKEWQERGLKYYD